MSRTVLLADGHPPTLTGVRRALELGGLVVVAATRDADSAVAAAERLRPDVALIDVALPGGGIDAADRMLAVSPGTAVVMLAASSRDEELFGALQAGATGYLLKDTAPARLPLAVEGVLEGEAALPRTLVARLIREYQGQGERDRRRSEGRAARLSDREWEVADLLAEGLSTREIAERLDVSPVTVRRHVSGLLEKLSVPTREDAVRLLARRA